MLVVAPEMGRQFVPAALGHRSHWYWKEVGEPVQEPGPPVSVSRARASPLTGGSAVFCGGPGLVPSVIAEAVSVCPPDAVAVTSTRS